MHISSFWSLGLAAALVLASPAHPSGDSTGTPLIRAYPRQVYDGSGTVFTATQGPRGVMYFATPSGLVEFDGERWRTTEIPGFLLALDRGSEGRLFLGGPNSLGYFSADATGALGWTGLESLLPEDQGMFSDIWPIVASREAGVLFAAREYLFRYRDGAIDSWPAGDPRHIFYRIYDLGGRIFVAQLQVGLVELTKDGALVPIAGNEILAPDAEINAMFHLGGDEFLMITRQHGAYRLGPEGIEPVSGTASRWLRQNQVQHGARLPDGRLAIGTRRGGVALIDESLELLSVLSEASGLSNDVVSFLFVDQLKNLWVTTDNGVNRVIFDRLNLYGPQVGLPSGAVYTVVSQPDELLVGTNLGLYRSVREEETGEPRTFEAVSGIESQTWELLLVDGTWLVATTDGVFQVELASRSGVSLDVVEQLTSATSTFSLARSSLDPDVLLMGGNGGVEMMVREAGRWLRRGRLEGIQNDVWSLLEGEDGEFLAEIRDIDKVAILQFSEGFDRPPQVHLVDMGFDASLVQGPEGPMLNGAGRQDRYLGLESALAGRAFAADPLLQKMNSLDASFIFYLEDSKERLWGQTESGLRLTSEGPEGYRLEPVSRQVLDSPIAVIEDVRLEEVFWLPTVDGLQRLSPEDEDESRPAVPTLIRRVVNMASGEVLDAGGAPGPARPERAAGPELEFAKAGLRFEYAAPVYDQEGEVFYRVRLDGFDEGWTSWSSEDFKEYSALTEGRYTFRVESQDGRGGIGPQASFRFAVLPPWYRTPLAYACYFLGAVGALVLVTRLRTLRLESRNRTLESEVRERTRELAEGVRQVEEQAEDLERMNHLLAEENEHRRVLEVERGKLQTRMEQSQKLESLGLMAGGIAHDFNNILTAILGNADLCLDEDDLPADLDRRLRSISEASQRAADLCQQMLAYAGKGQMEERELDLSIVTRETLDLLQVSIDPKIRIETDLASRLSAFIGDPTKIRQLVMNLLSNGSEAIGEARGVLRVTTGERFLSARDLQKVVLADPVPEGSYVFLRVEDTGSGMDEETQRKIFDPFFTTKFAGRGLGLAAALGILRGHGGAISVTSSPGEGTAFEVFFPALDHSADNLAAPSSEEIRRWRSTGTILVVDDEDIVRDVLTLMLRNTGFEVLAASSGHEAIQLYEKHSHGVAAVVLDLTMPGIDGLETFSELRRINPEVRVILSSGYSGDTLIERYMEQGFAAFVPKPFKVTTLRETLRRVLDS
ncbi:MAG: response regulator [Acidobacteriota bacterium]